MERRPIRPAATIEAASDSRLRSEVKRRTAELLDEAHGTPADPLDRPCLLCILRGFANISLPVATSIG